MYHLGLIAEDAPRIALRGDATPNRGDLLDLAVLPPRVGPRLRMAQAGLKMYPRCMVFTVQCRYFMAKVCCFVWVVVVFVWRSKYISVSCCLVAVVLCFFVVLAITRPPSSRGLFCVSIDFGERDWILAICICRRYLLVLQRSEGDLRLWACGTTLALVSVLQGGMFFMPEERERDGALPKRKQAHSSSGTAASLCVLRQVKCGRAEEISPALQRPINTVVCE